MEPSFPGRGLPWLGLGWLPEFTFPIHATKAHDAVRGLRHASLEFLRLVVKCPETIKLDVLIHYDAEFARHASTLGMEFDGQDLMPLYLREVVPSDGDQPSSLKRTFEGKPEPQGLVLACLFQYRIPYQEFVIGVRDHQGTLTPLTLRPFLDAARWTLPEYFNWFQSRVLPHVLPPEELAHLEPLPSWAALDDAQGAQGAQGAASPPLGPLQPPAGGRGEGTVQDLQSSDDPASSPPPPKLTAASKAMGLLVYHKEFPWTVPLLAEAVGGVSRQALYNDDKFKAFWKAWLACRSRGLAPGWRTAGKAGGLEAADPESVDPPRDLGQGEE